MCDIICFFFSSSSSENISIASAIQKFSALNKKKIIQFIYQSFGGIIGIKQLLLSVLLSLVGLVVFAQENIITERVYNTSRIVGSPPVIDGLVNDNAWELVDWSGDFTQKEPYEYEPPTQQTAFKLLFDDNNLYVAIRAFDTEPDKIEKRLSRRDGFDGDWRC